MNALNTLIDTLTHAANEGPKKSHETIAGLCHAVIAYAQEEPNGTPGSLLLVLAMLRELHGRLADGETVTRALLLDCERLRDVQQTLEKKATPASYDA